MTVGFRVVGRVRKAFGLKGELLVHPLTSEPGAVFAPGSLIFGGRELRVERSRAFKDGWLVKFEGIDDKTAADSWRGVDLTSPTSALKPPSGNEVYLDELAGMRVRDDAHGDLGLVESWYELPQGLVLEVRGANWEADVPFNEAFVREIDRATRTIAVQLPEGLLQPRPAPANSPPASQPAPRA